MDSKGNCCWIDHRDDFISASAAVRKEIRIPDIAGYRTLKCDFHMHTVFSDGNVWPTVRVDEAWREGLDAIAITDHVEYHPHKEDIPPNIIGPSKSPNPAPGT